jgi:hypothetical protein
MSRARPQLIGYFLRTVRVQVYPIRYRTRTDDGSHATDATHRDRSAITWIIHLMAGHQIHHLRQLDQIGEQP